MASIFGRSIIVPLTNKSGGGVVLGDVVVVDTTTDESFTTTTSAASTSAIGVAAETIASNAVGRVIVGGYASLVNVNASVTRNQFGTTHTVAKQAVASATRVAGTFCRWLKTSATPSAYIYPVDLAGAALTNPMSAVGDIIQGGTAGAPEALAAPLAGKVLTGAGVTTRVAYAYPPGYEFDYAQITAGVTVTATTQGTSNTIVDGNAVSYDGSTIVMLEFFSPAVSNSGISLGVRIAFYDGATLIDEYGANEALLTTSTLATPVLIQRRYTPTNASHTFHVKAYGTSANGVVNAGAGGAAAYPPAFLRITKV